MHSILLRALLIIRLNYLSEEFTFLLSLGFQNLFQVHFDNFRTFSLLLLLHQVWVPVYIIWTYALIELLVLVWRR